MRVLIFHGYLLDGTGSNVYNACLAEALVRLGHEVHLVCQDRHPERHRFVDAVGSWAGGSLQVRTLREPVCCTVYRPRIGELLPVYVHDRYEGIEARTFTLCTDAEVANYLRLNVDAVREVAARARPDLALANHLIMGPVILARALAGQVRYAVAVHGSALEYTVNPEPERFLGYAREGLASASAVLVGSAHAASRLWETMGEAQLRQRTRVCPPGVDVERFSPCSPPEAEARLNGLIERLRATSLVPSRGRGGDRRDTFARDEAAAANALERLAGGSGEIVAFIGKLIPAKGIDLLLASWPLVLRRCPRTTLAVVGFGSWSEQAQRLCQALASGDLEQVEQLALPNVRAFLRGLTGHRRQCYVTSASALAERVVLTGRLEHDELADLLPCCDALVVPSVFPEAFGMVAAEAAACGTLPICAEHSGLLDIRQALAAAIPQQSANWLSFPIDERVVGAIADRVICWLQASEALRRETVTGLVSVARESWSWERVARQVIDGARGAPGARGFG